MTILLGVFSGLCFAAGALAWRDQGVLSRVIAVVVFLIGGILGLIAFFLAAGQYAGICY